jgi:hypothetical protein
MTINKEQAVSDAMIEAGFNAAGSRRYWLDENSLSAIYLAMKAASHPQQAVSDATKRMAKIMDCDFVPHDRMKRVEEAAPHPNLIERLNRSVIDTTAFCPSPVYRNPDGPEAAHAISTLTAEVEAQSATIERMTSLLNSAIRQIREFRATGQSETATERAIRGALVNAADAPTLTKGEGDKPL